MNSPDALDLSGFRKPSKPAPTPTGGEEKAEPATVEAVPEKTPPEAAARPDSGSVSRDTTGRVVAATTARRRAPRTPGADSDGRLVVALPVALRDRARKAAAEQDETYAEIVLRSIEETHEQLSDLVAAHRGDGRSVGSLFEHRAKPKRMTEGTVQVTVRGLSPRDRGVLDELVDEVGAANLTELITVALDAHLPAAVPAD